MFWILQAIDVTFGSKLWGREAYFLCLTCVFWMCFWARRRKQTDGCQRWATVITSPHRPVSCNVFNGKSQAALLPITGEPPGREETSAALQVAVDWINSPSLEQARWRLFIALFMGANSHSDDCTSHTSLGRDVLLFPWQPEGQTH